MKPDRKFYTSALSEYCADNLPGDFHFFDGDEVLFRHSSQPIVYARETGILRFLESKRTGEQIRRSQRETLPLIAGVIQLGITAGIIHELSGVFVIEGDPPWLPGALVSRVVPAIHAGRDWSSVGLQYESTHRVTKTELNTFIRCRKIATDAVRNVEAAA